MIVHYKLLGYLLLKQSRPSKEATWNCILLPLQIVITDRLAITISYLVYRIDPGGGYVRKLCLSYNHSTLKNDGQQ